MGAVTACGPCCGEEPRKSTSDEQYESSSSSSSSDEHERKPFKKSSQKSKKKKKKGKKRDNIERDESFIDVSDEADSDADRKRRKRKKDKKRKKKNKKATPGDINDGMDQLQHADRGGNGAGSEHLLYGMDTRTMELLLDVQDISTSTPRNHGDEPEPSFPSIGISDPNANDHSKLNIINANSEDNEAPPHSDDDLKIQLQKYSSSAMYDSAQNTPANEDATAEMYETLAVEDEQGDKLPDLPNIQNKNNSNENHKKYDLASIANEGFLGSADEEDDEATMSKLNTLRSEEKTVDPKRVEMLHAHLQRSQGHDEMKRVIAQQYNVNAEDEEEEMHTETESELDEEEQAEIERRKTEEMMKKEEAAKLKTDNSAKAKLFRPDTTTPWDEEDVHESMNEMSQHLEWMKRQHSSEKDVNAPESQLYRHKSAAKWAVEDLEQENKAMQQQLVHLLQTQDSNPKI
mmetsp:Transcript_51515/g.82132  ORF Transcript_51515/g.82132 Transcript_51515/m.82132 type:complete len:460 (+) Transcript_51515:78-1457(+)